MAKKKKYRMWFGLILLIILACAKFDFNNPVDADNKKNPPELLSPADNTTINDNTPTLTWSADDQVALYALQVDNNANFSSPKIDQSSITADTFTPTDTLLDGQYYWRVRARYGEDAWTEWSTIGRIAIDTSVPTVIIPINGFPTNDDTPVFNWNCINDATGYELIVDNSNSFNSPEINQSGLTSSSYTATSLLSDGTYYWRVRCRDSAGNWGEWSGGWSFTIDTEGPATPILSSPSDGSFVTDDKPDFDWTDISDASEYELEVDYSSSFSSPEINYTLSISNHTATISLTDSTYYWRVRCRDDAGNWSEWSETWSITIDTEGPTSPILSSPSDGSLVADDTPDFDWDNVDGASIYFLQVYNVTRSLSNPEISQNDLIISNYTATNSLSNGTHYWRVRCRDEAGNWSGWSDMWSFVIVQEAGTVTDIDGNTYQTVKVGNQWWMAENLRVTHYRNGDPIPNVTNKTNWFQLSTGAYCVHDNDENNVDTYGYLYNWYAVSDSRNLAPEGWHVPTYAEWQTLVQYLGGSSIAGGKLKEAGIAHWNTTNTGATNESGFTALPGGWRDGGNNGNFSPLGSYAGFWSATDTGLNHGAWIWRLLNNSSEITRQGDDFGKNFGLSIRLIQD